jgi:predicted ATP-binding protein involved in virulence
MKLIRIDIIKLFNRYSYKLDFSKNSDVAIITGPNGYGKSTILRLINHICSGNIYPLFDIIFERLFFTFKIDKKATIELSVEKQSNLKNENTELSDINDNNNATLLFTLKEPNQTSTVLLKKTDVESEIRATAYIKGKNHLWWKNDSSEYYTSNEILLNHNEIFQKLFNKATNISMFLGGLNALFISDQRLYYHEFENEPSSKNAVHFNKAQVNKDARWMKKNIDEFKKKFSENLSKAMVEAISAPTTYKKDIASINKQLETINKKLDKLIQFGIADEKQRVSNTKNAQTAALIINGYEKVVNGMLDEIENHIKFANLITNSDFPDKTININSSNGFCFLTNDGTNINPDCLSSGEQHKLILWFHLLFRAKPGMIVLIDEPELSFHVVWQSSFINELKQIISKNNIQVIAATHSPQIIDGKWSITTDLYELATKK